MVTMAHHHRHHIVLDVLKCFCLRIPNYCVDLAMVFWSLNGKNGGSSERNACRVSECGRTTREYDRRFL